MVGWSFCERICFCLFFYCIIIFPQCLVTITVDRDECVTRGPHDFAFLSCTIQVNLWILINCQAAINSLWIAHADMLSSQTTSGTTPVIYAHHAWQSVSPNVHLLIFLVKRSIVFINLFQWCQTHFCHKPQWSCGFLQKATITVNIICICGPHKMIWWAKSDLAPWVWCLKMDDIHFQAETKKTPGIFKMKPGEYSGHFSISAYKCSKSVVHNRRDGSSLQGLYSTWKS